MSIYNQKSSKGFLRNLFSIVLVSVVSIFSSCLKDDINHAEGVPSDYMAILDLRGMYKGEDLVLTRTNMFGAAKITGVVISDGVAGNIPDNYLVMQQTSRLRTRGIVVVLPQGISNYKLGDSLVFDVEGASLVRRNGVMQITGLLPERIEKKAENIFYSATQVSLEELNKNFANYEATLIRVAHVDATTAGSAIAGKHEIVDIPKRKAELYVQSSANFANKILPINASYVGIPLWNNPNSNETQNASQQIWVRSLQDITDESGALYENFPEYFEVDDPSLAGSGYAGTKSFPLLSGTYLVTNGFLGGEANDRAVSGKYAVRFNQNSTSDSWCAMNDDLRFGASKITVWVGAYGASADLGSTWRLEYSQDGGNIWYQIGNDILTTSKDKQQYTFLTDIKGPVRFRVGKVGVGTSTTSNQNGRLSIDDFAVYKHPDDDGTGVIVLPTFSPLCSWQFGTPQSTGAETSANASYKVAAITTPVLTRGFGLNSPTLARAFVSNAKDVLENGSPAQIIATKAIAIAQKAYFQIDFNTTTGSAISITAIDAKIRRSGAGGKNHAWYYSINDGEYKPTGAGTINYELTTGEGDNLPTNYLHNTAELQNIAPGTKVSLRAYVWGFTNFNSGSFAFGRTAAGTTTPALIVGGTVH